MENVDTNLDANQCTRQEIQKLSTYAKVLAVIIVLLLLYCIYIINGKSDDKLAIGLSTKTADAEIKDVANIHIEPFPDGKEGEMASYGHKLITETYKYLGPEIKEGMLTGNNLSCSSCHLNAGTKAYAAPYVGLSGVFPIYIGRENKIESLEERINGCFERSMNGKALPTNSKEMRAIISYIKHLSKHIPVGERIAGQGFVKITVPERAANPKSGAAVFQQYCVSCHGENGQGHRKGKVGDGKGYLYPPLWGGDSFNDGAGMARLLTAAKFIKGNMPLGATAENPILTDEEAYDVAAYINDFNRPKKSNKEADYPDLLKKPKDCPYPPYADNINIKQHKLGPFNF